MTSFWRHSRLNHYDLRSDFLTQCVKLLSGEVCEGSKRNSRYFGSYSWKNTGVLTAPIRVKVKPHLISSHLLFNNITYYCTIQSWHWHKSASRFVPHPRGPKTPLWFSSNNSQSTGSFALKLAIPLRPTLSHIVSKTQVGSHNWSAVSDVRVT